VIEMKKSVEDGIPPPPKKKKKKKKKKKRKENKKRRRKKYKFYIKRFEIFILKV